jgi:queuine tRNA-ribosyltransferase
VEFQNRLTAYFREGIVKGELGEYERRLMRLRYPAGDYPAWIVEALASEGIDLSE